MTALMVRTNDGHAGGAAASMSAPRGTQASFMERLIRAVSAARSFRKVEFLVLAGRNSTRQMSDFEVKKWNR